MKKIIVLSLILSTSFMQGASFAKKCRKKFWTLIKPFESIDGEAIEKIKEFNTEPTVLLGSDMHDKYIHGDERRAFQSAFPQDDATSVHRVSKIMILEKYKRLRGLEMTTFNEKLNEKDTKITFYKTYTSPVNYEKLWLKQPFKDRLWWTMRYIRPYTYGLTLLKWSSEAAVVAGAGYGITKLVKQYKKKTNPELTTANK